MKRARVYGLLVAALLTAESAFARDVTVQIMIYSDPAGATLYANTAESNMGYAPLLLKYKVSSKDWKPGQCANMQPVKVRWASGVEASVDHVVLCQKDGTKQQLTFVRPIEAPGRDLDVQFAIEVQRIAAGRAAAASVPVIVPAPAPAVHCTSTRIGQQTFTNCY